MSEIVEPVAWIEFADNGNIRFWTSNADRARRHAVGRNVQAFTLAELVAALARDRVAAEPKASADRRRDQGAPETRGSASACPSPSVPTKN